MSLPSVVPHRNGHNVASSKSDEVLFSDTPTSPSGPFPQPANQTVFPVDPPQSSMRSIFYNVATYYFGGLTLFRWTIMMLCALLVMASIGSLINWSRWSFLLLATVVLLVLLLGMMRRFKKRDYVRFVDSLERPDVEATRLDVADKIPVHVTGLFAVEGKEQRFTWLPGFYRTFATREHAFLCLNEDKRFLFVGRTDAETAGMWYIFVHPEAMLEVRWGTIYFGSEPRQCIALTHEVELNHQSRFRRDKLVREVAYISFQDESLGLQIWADLHVEFGALNSNSDVTRRPKSL